MAASSSSIVALFVLLLIASLAAAQPATYVLSLFSNGAPVGYRLATLADYQSVRFQQQYNSIGLPSVGQNNVGNICCNYRVAEGYLYFPNAQGSNYLGLCSSFGGSLCLSFVTVNQTFYLGYYSASSLQLFCPTTNRYFANATTNTVNSCGNNPSDGWAIYTLLNAPTPSPVSPSPSPVSPAPSPAGVNCPSLSSQGCRGCVANSACGWCSSANKCVAGNGIGPNEGSCPDWQYNVCSNCAGYSSCINCLNDPSCGWCPSAGVCLAGNSTAPYSKNCKDWSFYTCSAPLQNYTMSLSSGSCCFSSCASQNYCGVGSVGHTCVTTNGNIVFSPFFNPLGSGVSPKQIQLDTFINADISCDAPQFFNMTFSVGLNGFIIGYFSVSGNCNTSGVPLCRTYNGATFTGTVIASAYNAFGSNTFTVTLAGSNNFSQHQSLVAPLWTWSLLY